MDHRDEQKLIQYLQGSTGKPKGVVLTYGNTHQMLATMNHDYAFTASDRFLHQSSICFDLSIVQIFSALTCGATVCVATADTRKDPSALASFMLNSGVTVTYFTPTHFSLLIDSSTDVLQQCQNYRISYFAGERLPTRLVNRFYSLGTPATIYNTWSPSELVVQTAIAKVTGEQSEQVNIPIGFPMANCRHYILDTHLNPSPWASSASYVSVVLKLGPDISIDQRLMLRHSSKIPSVRPMIDDVAGQGFSGRVTRAGSYPMVSWNSTVELPETNKSSYEDFELTLEKLSTASTEKQLESPHLSYSICQ